MTLFLTYMFILTVIFNRRNNNWCSYNNRLE